MTLNSTIYGYLFSKESLINHLLFLDDPKLYGKIEQITIIVTCSLGNIKRYWRGFWNGQMQYCAYKEMKNL